MIRRLRRVGGCLAPVVAVLVSFSLAGCASGPKVWTEPAYQAGGLSGRRVLFARLAVSDDFEDARTGVMLSGRTRSASAREACSRTARAWTSGRIACFSTGDDATISELELLFAKDQSIPARVWASVRAASNADLLLLFRPESAEATQDIEQAKLDSDDTAVSTSTIVSGTHAAPIQTTNETERTYTISASLFDLRSGKPLKRGVHSGSASRTEKHYAGIAPAPDAVPLLADIMTDLARALLEE
jgi:hypothetical protein